ncbi:MAG: phosphoglucosamine mutase [Bacteroidales bacterium]|nr:phosphoglucosamine mutase [Bacteroidales bacterium]
MSLIKSISGIRGTVGGAVGSNLTPVDIVSFVYAYQRCMRESNPPVSGGRYRFVVGRDARISGPMVEQLVCGTLCACGADVVRIGLASTPTTELAVQFAGADGGIIITASHNPRQWNALKLLNSKGEFLSAAEGGKVLECAAAGGYEFASVDEIGHVTDHDYTDAHIDSVLALEAVDAEAVRAAGFKVVLDPVNSVGGIIMPRLLERLGVRCEVINGEPTGDFAHNPEPLPAHLTALGEAVVKSGADLGVSVDPDVDRLAFICENGEPFVEENTLVSVADYLLEDAVSRGVTPLVTVSNLSSSRGLRDVTEARGGVWYPAAVGEVNVTTLMHEKGALIGGEGNGGVIYPASHYGRDAMVGVALFLSCLARRKCSVSALKASLPQYHIAKARIDLPDFSKVPVVIEGVKKLFAGERMNTVDGLKIDFEASRSWVHIRPSNTEPIMRVYAEAPSQENAESLAAKVLEAARGLLAA